MSTLRGIGKGYRARLAAVLEKEPRLLSPARVSEILGISRQEAGRLLARWNKGGWVRRVKRGLYIPVPISSTSAEPPIEDPLLIADRVYGPGYVAGLSAVKHWDLTEQIIETTTFFTTNLVRDRRPTLAGVRFRLKTIVPRKLFGTESIWIGSNKIQVSDPTKTVVDLLDDPTLVGGMTIVAEIFSEFRDSGHYELVRLIEYVDQMGNRAIAKRLGFLMQTMFEVEPAVLDKLRKRISQGYSKLDSTPGPSLGVREWGLKVSPPWKALYDRKK